LPGDNDGSVTPHILLYFVNKTQVKHKLKGREKPLETAAAEIRLTGEQEGRRKNLLCLGGVV